MRKMSVRVAQNVLGGQISMLNPNIGVTSPKGLSIIKDSVTSSNIDKSFRVDSSLKKEAPKVKGNLTVGFNSMEPSIPGLNRIDVN